MIPELLHIPIPFLAFELPVYTFGFFMLCCFLGAMKLLEKILSQLSMDTAVAEHLVTWCAVGGIIGARVLSILTNPQDLIENPLGTILSSSGFVFYGGFFGGFLAGLVFLSVKKYSPFSMSDVVAAPLAFGYGIGRIGCQLSGDGDYGDYSSLPWAMNYIYGVIPVYERVHPTPVYESICAFLITLILLAPGVRKFLFKEGQIFGMYLVLSAISRFLVEFLRIEPVVFMELTQAQVFSLLLLIPGVYLLARKTEKLSLFEIYSRKK